MDNSRLEITKTSTQLCTYTAREAGIAVLAHTDAGTADLFVDGGQYTNVLSGLTPLAGGKLVRLRARSAGYYIAFDLLGPIAPELLAEMGDQYIQLIQARLTPEQMSELLSVNSQNF